ncbi:type VI secretion system baseplate subunit TssG [Salmonella enterica subsp. enterica]|nr:type VI secretion system baseplate subunit TssG [Salmonella enterica subsp. enterica]MIF51072.1 type VI secretion system baseplate subunit TssG [Salmonella enterica subsp. enterica]
MGRPNRSACADVDSAAGISDSLFSMDDINVRRHNFFALVDAIYRFTGRHDDISLATDPDDDVVRFEADPRIAFPGSDVVGVQRNDSGQYVVKVAFSGLHGSQSPLPGYYLDQIAWESAQGESGMADFLDLFSHRMIQFVWHIWRKYRWHICFNNGGTDEFTQRMYALVGLGSKTQRDRLAINHSKMLAYAGVLAGPGRSSEIVCDLVSHCFDLEDVALQRWQLRKVDISPSQQNQLGGYLQRDWNRLPRSVLGQNFTLGSRVPDRSGKFLLRIRGLSRERFLSFLPNGDSFLPLTLFVAFILRDQFAWDLRLEMAPEQIGGMTLGDERTSRLGWTTFVGQPETCPGVTIRVRA